MSEQVRCPKCNQVLRHNPRNGTSGRRFKYVAYCAKCDDYWTKEGLILLSVLQRIESKLLRLVNP
jgi:uncharacterized protein with PIN domain